MINSQTLLDKFLINTYKKKKSNFYHNFKLPYASRHLEIFIWEKNYKKNEGYKLILIIIKEIYFFYRSFNFLFV